VIDCLSRRSDFLSGKGRQAGMGNRHGRRKAVKEDGKEKSAKPRVTRRDTTEHVEILLKKGPITDYYEIDKNAVLGKGHYATVYRGRDKKTGLHVAVKVIQISKSRIEALKREVEVLRKVGKHPNIVSLYDIFITDSELILVLELLLGGELFDRMVEKGPYSEKDASHHIRKIGAALKFLHRAGIVHRDLKPENLILTHKGDNSELKIADFGLANIVDNTENATMKTVCGTWAYCAPEVKTSMTEEGGHACYTAKVDLWSVGVILFVVLAAYHPFDPDGDASDAKLWSNICSGEFDFNDPAWDGISASAKDLIKNLIVVDPNKRFGTDELLNHPWVRQSASVPATPITPNINRCLIDYNDKRKSRKSFGNKLKFFNPLGGGGGGGANPQQENGGGTLHHQQIPPTPVTPPAYSQPITAEDLFAQQRILHEQQLAEQQEKLKNLHLQEQQQLKQQQQQQVQILHEQVRAEEQRIIHHTQHQMQIGQPVPEEEQRQAMIRLQQQTQQQEHQLLSIFQQQQQQMVARQEQQQNELKSQFDLKLLQQQQQQQIRQTHFIQNLNEQQKSSAPHVRFAAEPIQPQVQPQVEHASDDGGMQDDEGCDIPQLPQLTLNTLLPPAMDTE
jgi:serine/threonine protein kinase